MLFHVIWDALLDRMAQHPRVRKYMVVHLLFWTLAGLAFAAGFANTLVALNPLIESYHESLLLTPFTESSQ